MDAAELNEVCRLCPSSGGGEDLMHVFDERLSVKNNMKEVILVTTGVEIQDSDLISKKICQRCCTKTLQMFLFRQDALTQDRALKEKCSRFLEDKGIRLPNTCITIKRERSEPCLSLKRPKVEVADVPPTTIKAKRKKILHPSVADIYKNYPHIKLPKKCLERHLAPVVSFTMGEVEKYFKKNKLDMRLFIYKPGTKRPSNAVAKKRTSFPTKQKTVSPIKISKKVFENHDLQTSSTNIDYVCISVHKKEKKKSVSSPEAVKCLLSKIPHDSKATHSPPSAVLIKAPELPKLPNKNLPEKQIPVAQPPIPVPQTPKTVVTITPRGIDPISKESRENCSSGTSKPEFIESLGLTPTVTATKSQTLHVCNLCGSVHNNAFKLKTHTRKHMVCQFCKLRFKSLGSKQDHVDNSCQVKEILNSSRSVVELEKIDLNLATRKQFRDVFSTFETIPGLTELDSVEQVIVKAGSPPPRLDTDDVILLSDEEEVQTRSSDIMSGAAPSTSALPPLETENNVNSSVSLVRPEVKIKNDTVLDNIVTDTDDKQVVKDLLGRLKPQRARTVDKVLQTDLPATKDIKINNAEGFCEFKYLKEQLLSYKIPVSITDGPFHVAYQYKNNSNPTKNLALWDDLSVIDVYSKTVPNQSESRESPPYPTNFPTVKVTATNLQVQSTHISSSVPPTTTNSGPSSIRNNSSIRPAVGNSSSSATPLLQNFAESTTPPDVDKSIPIPKTYVTPRRNLSSGGKVATNRPVSSSSTLCRKLLPSNISKSGKTNSSGAMNRSSSSTTLISESSRGSTLKTNTVANSTAVLSRTDSNSTQVSETSRFRVKNVWELQ